MQQVVSPRVVGRTPSRGSHPEPWVAPRAVRGIGGGGRVVLRLELYRALQHVCVLAGGGGGVALHPKLYRALQCGCGGGLRCTPSCAG